MTSSVCMYYSTGTDEYRSNALLEFFEYALPGELPTLLLV